jgi:hypothetical protein
MRTGALLLLIAAVLAGCTKTPADATVSTTSTTATTATTATSATTDNRSAAEKAVGAGLRARDKAEELKREADAKAKETDATNE